MCDIETLRKQLYCSPFGQPQHSEPATGKGPSASDVRCFCTWPLWIFAHWPIRAGSATMKWSNCSVVFRTVHHKILKKHGAFQQQLWLASSISEPVIRSMPTCCATGDLQAMLSYQTLRNRGCSNKYMYCTQNNNTRKKKRHTNKEKKVLIERKAKTHQLSLGPSQLCGYISAQPLTVQGSKLQNRINKGPSYKIV